MLTKDEERRADLEARIDELAGLDRELNWLVDAL